MAAPLQRLAGKVIVLAGGAGGIGSATAQRLAAEGARVVVGDIDQAAAEQVAAAIAAIGGNAIGAAVDIGNRESVDELVDLALATWGRLDGLHANAADLSIQHRDKNALEIDLAMWEHILHVDLTGYLYCTRAALPALLASGGGALVYTSSEAAFYGEDVRVAYAVAKSGVNALMRHVARGWGKQGIRANAIAPGLVLSPTVAALPEEFREQILAGTCSTRLGDCADIAAMVAHLMSDDGTWVQGQVLSVNGGSLFH
ncbi:MAG: SDR family oxidoreductase [Porticoccaceae bacterium]|jgi:NAD(P)-dependent dehydrogenase (short-subunit alcohol dehydrogenase family)|nr:SDR family oxidoreductase [Porticoccaceae bacterium]HLS99847.1 SDR family oxidoreductase [Porticoccaceae bacterium]